MIEVKAAIVRAMKFLIEAFPDERISDVRLEEVVLSEDDLFWHITLSFVRPLRAATDIAAEMDKTTATAHSERDYKVLAIHTNDGRIQSMRIRQTT